MLQTKMEYKNKIMQVIHNKCSHDHSRADQENRIVYQFQISNRGNVRQVELDIEKNAYLPLFQIER